MSLFLGFLQALWKAGKVIRGGISICFPQVINYLVTKLLKASFPVEFLFVSCAHKSANFGSPEQPGFVRNRLWSIDSSPSRLLPANSNTTVDLVLKSTDDDLKTWPHR